MSRSVYSTFDRGKFFEGGGGQNFSMAENNFLSVLPLGPKISSFYDCIFAFLDWLHNF